MLPRYSLALSLALGLASAAAAAPPAWRSALDGDLSHARFLDASGAFELEAQIESRLDVEQVLIEFESTDDVQLIDPPPPFSGSIPAGETLVYTLQGRVLPGTHGTPRVVMTVDHRVPSEALAAEVRRETGPSRTRAVALRRLESRSNEIETAFYPLFVRAEEVVR